MMKHMPKKPKLIEGKTEAELKTEMLTWFGNYARAYGDINPLVKRALRFRSMISEPMTIKQIQYKVCLKLQTELKYDHIKIGVFELANRGILDFASAKINQDIYRRRDKKDGSKYLFFQKDLILSEPKPIRNKIKSPSLLNGMEKEIKQVINQMDLQKEIARFNGGMKSAIYKDGILITAHRMTPEKAIAFLRGLK